MAPTAYKVKKFTGDLPALNGKERIPTPFDDIVKEAFTSGDTLIVQVPQDEKARAEVIALLHKAAKFVGCGLDLWRSLEEGVAFKARTKRDVTRKPTGEAQAA